MLLILPFDSGIYCLDHDDGYDGNACFVVVVV